MPEISVIIPVYNGADFIKRCYDSIKNQTFKDLEMIFVDDESKDNSLEILRELEKKDNKVKVIAQKNKKQGGARNTGLKNANGNYISFVDVDDYISEDFLEALYNTAKKFDADISMTSVTRIKPNGDERVLLKYDKEECYKETVQKANITNGNGTGRGVWNKLYKKDFLSKNLLFFRENVSYEDCDFCTQAVYLAGKIATSTKGTYFYYVNKKSTMRCSLDKKKQQDKYTGIKLTALFDLNHGITKYPVVIPKFDYSFYGWNLLRIKEKIYADKTTEQYWLFDFIKIFEKKIN